MSDEVEEDVGAPEPDADDEPSIRVITNHCAAVRQRPGMYVGNTDDGTGVLHMVGELVANALDLYLRQACSRIDVTWHEDHVVVADDGPGMPFDDAPDVHDSSAMQALRTLHFGPTRDDHVPHVHAMTAHGLGLAPVVCLSERFEVDSVRAGARWQAHFAVDELRACEVGDADGAPDGTTVRMWPDRTLFSQRMPEQAVLERMLREIAMLLSPVHLRLDGVDLTDPVGLEGHARGAPGASPAHTTFRIRELVEDVLIDAVVLADTEPCDNAPDVVSWVNGSLTSEHGAHVIGVLDGCAFAGLSPHVVRVHALAFDPRFGGPVRHQLVHPTLAAAIAQRVVNHVC